MERFRIPLLILDGLVAVAASAIALLWAINVVDVTHFAAAAHYVGQWGFWARAGAVVLAVYLALFNVLFVSVNFLFSKYATHLEFATAEGQVSVHMGAIEESLTRAAKAILEVEDVRVSLYKERQNAAKPLHVFCSCTTWEEVNLPELTEKIRGVLKERMKEIAALPEAPVFDVHISKILERPEEKEKPPSKKDAKKAAELFHGPEYPIGLDN
ncbi:MAG: hypothetical protein HYY18_08005 [Planctomycetes bacterium]|nr:hypothetical protein [Planctomycetota bacterium]